MLHYETKEPGTLSLFKSLLELPILAETRLVGGTALALQLGRRKSVDLVFFGKVSATSEELRTTLIQAGFKLSVVRESRNINIYDINGIKVDFVNYIYDWIGNLVTEDGLRLADAKDIAAMKINAIIGRGTRKDFVDLFFLLQHFSLKEMLEMFQEKYPEGSMFLALKSVAYFEDAENSPMPVMLKKVPWSLMKKTILANVKAL